MRRRGDPVEDPDSDLSISEDEGFDEGSSSYSVSLGENASQQPQEAVHVLFQLERRRADTSVSLDGGIATPVTRTDKAGQVEHGADVLSFGDNVGLAPSGKDDFLCVSGYEEIVSYDKDEEYTCLISSFNRGGCPTSPSQKNELLESASWKLKDGYDTLRKPWNLVEQPENCAAKNTEYPFDDELEDFDEQHGNRSVLLRSNTTTFPLGHGMQSIADFLDGLQEKTSLSEENLVAVKKRKKVSHSRDIKREAADTRFLDEVSPDPIGGVSSSSGEESNYGACNHPISHGDGSTMVERFQEILDSTSLANVDSLYSVLKPSRPLAFGILRSSGIFGQLQRVMQRQNDMDVEFLKSMQDGGCCGKIFRDVLILSKQLDANFTVCQCSLMGNLENPLSSDGAEVTSTIMERTIIFSPRVCNNVDMEIGSTIRIYPPWLEVRPRKGHTQNPGMILCAYYSQIST